MVRVMTKRRGRGRGHGTKRKNKRTAHLTRNRSRRHRHQHGSRVSHGGRRFFNRKLDPQDLLDAHDVAKAIRDGVKKGIANRAAAAADDARRKRTQHRQVYFQAAPVPLQPAKDPPIKVQIRRKGLHKHMATARAVNMENAEDTADTMNVSTSAAAAEGNSGSVPSFQLTPSTLMANAEGASSHQMARSAAAAAPAAAAEVSNPWATAFQNTPSSLTSSRKFKP